MSRFDAFNLLVRKAFKEGGRYGGEVIQQHHRVV